ncbi:serine/threonine protein kinase [Acanthopleuribacter pedis]|uniref:Serine/threonine protein kinase n=1 Tax=Acanthopleuribacter pedis TaxID=442870 RepID=A0A8J7U5X5_9BACT|nr:serine/threonine-protein kinase [Acanthopleuribacter pedis]MBO1319761.1 serine/threonine protein kinase [Acanthopleuribacter pedis]
MSEKKVSTEEPSTQSDPLIGAQLGPYQIVRLIGSGGMGRVYEGRQSGPINKKVAIKVMRCEASTHLMRRRFKMELRTLAALNHPNIATIYLSGTRTDNEDWFAMEYVEGASLIEYVRKHRLTVPECLKLFKKICNAVHFAHQRGVIHRDIKPANILVCNVDGEASPKIIDFGIAKSTAEGKSSLERVTLVTKTAEPALALGTLGYMSPEQTRLDDDDIDVRSDIYSLGVVLYEMLVGKRLIDEKRIRSVSWDQAFELVRDYEPEKPSKAIRHKAIGHSMILKNKESVAPLSKYYRGDLDWIVLKALEKNRERRYQGADLLAEDINSFLNGLPIDAGPQTWIYQTVRFTKRNRAIVSGLTLTTAGIFFSLIGLVFGYIEAKEREAQAIRETNTARKNLKYLNAFMTFENNYAGRQNRVIDRLNHFAPADENANSLDKRILRYIGNVYQWTGEYKKSEHYLRAAYDNYIKEEGQNSLTANKILVDYAFSARALGKYKDADWALTEALPIFESMLPPEDESYIRLLNAFSVVSYRRSNFNKAEGIFKKLEETDWDLVKNKNHHLINFHGAYGSFQAISKGCNEAIPYFRKASEISQTHFKTLNSSALVSTLNLAMCQCQTKDFKNAKTTFDFYLGQIIKTHGKDHPDVITSQLNWGYCLTQNKEFKRAIDWISSLQIKVSELGLTGHHYYFSAQTNLAISLSEIGMDQEAISVTETIVIKKQEVYGNDNISTLGSLSALASFHLKANDPSTAIEVIEFSLSCLDTNKDTHLRWFQTFAKTGKEAAETTHNDELIEHYTCILVDTEKMPPLQKNKSDKTD